MTITNELEKKLASLRQDYRNKLPEKIDEISTIWKSIKKQADTETMTLFHRKAHSLHGSANTYGYTDIGKVGANLENIARSILDNPQLITENSVTIDKLLDELKILAASEDNQPQEIQKVEAATDLAKVVYLLDNDTSWEINFASQITTFGYEILRFNEVKLLIDQLKKQKPTILIININLVDEQLQNLLIDKNRQLDDSKIPIIFISTSGEFDLRLKAVRLGGKGYFIKPFLIEDLVSQIDFLLQIDIEPSRILIVDDEIDVASYNAAILEQAKMKTSIITKANEIDRALHEFNPDLILIDILMPDCNGLELATIIRQQAIFQSTPIIYLSAEEDQEKQLNAMELGADDFLTKSTPSKYLIMTIRNRVARYKKLRSLTVRDNLTGLYNYSFMLKQLEIELKESMQLHNPLSVALIDLDKFKNINETYSHQAGDHVLKSLGLMISKRLHANDIVGRYGGENFLVILPNTTLEAAKTLIDDLRKQFLTINYSWNEQIFNASFSAGIASFPDFHTGDELLEAARESITKSKKLGRNRVEAAT